jgi:type I restriction enzyme M protein
VPISDLEAKGFNLDLRNPNGPEDLAHRPPSELLDEIVKIEREILAALEDVQEQMRSSS